MIGRIARRILAPWRSHRLQSRIFREAIDGAAALSAGFPAGATLPKPFGQGLPERVVELALARLLYKPGARILDVGHAYAMTCHRRTVAALPAPRHFTGIDIAEPTYNTRPLYESSLRADIVASQLPAASFDQVWCISTLEHFGMDNSGYTTTFTRESSLPQRALAAMLGLLKPGGILLITVPFGRFEDHGWQVVYDEERWTNLLAPALSMASLDRMYFRHTAGTGWQVVPPAELAFTGYYDQANAGAAGMAAAILTRT